MRVGDNLESSAFAGPLPLAAQHWRQFQFPRFLTGTPIFGWGRAREAGKAHMAVVA